MTAFHMYWEGVDASAAYWLLTQTSCDLIWSAPYRQVYHTAQLAEIEIAGEGTA